MNSMGVYDIADGRRDVRPRALQGASLHSLKSYISQPDFKLILNNLVRVQSQAKFRSLAVVGEGDPSERGFFVCALALGYTCYLQSRVLIVETIEQPSQRSLFLECILGEHSPEGTFRKGIEPGHIDLLTTEN
ncbi:MAG: hypothetical protein KDD60_12955, partial [Bdellovibrionales bacterium]|nr:hypothetical protein [Bdellovibrionales bacterium]